MSAQTTAERRARALVALYPRAWRERYGEEFELLLVDDICERPRSLARTLDIVRSGLLTHASFAGLSGDALEGEAQVRAGLRSLSLALVVFLTAAVAVWAQLTVGWQWSPPRAELTTTAMLLLSTAMALFAVIALAAALPPIFAAVTELLAHRDAKLGRAMLTCALACCLLISGSIHFGHGWPGTGGHPWAERGLVPAFAARSCWAATLWITSYWAHPGALASFPASEVVWMLVSPIALITAVMSAARTIRRVPLSKRVLRYEAWLGLAAAFVMAGAVAGAASWLLGAGPDPHGLFRAGAIDAVALMLMSSTLLLGFRAGQRTLAATRGPGFRRRS